jgi:hypothetical protein
MASNGLAPHRLLAGAMRDHSRRRLRAEAGPAVRQNGADTRARAATMAAVCPRKDRRGSCFDPVIAPDDNEIAPWMEQIGLRKP